MGHFGTQQKEGAAGHTKGSSWDHRPVDSGPDLPKRGYYHVSESRRPQIDSRWEVLMEGKPGNLERHLPRRVSKAFFESLTDRPVLPMESLVCHKIPTSTHGHMKSGAVLTVDTAIISCPILMTSFKTTPGPASIGRTPSKYTPRPELEIRRGGRGRSA